MSDDTIGWSICYLLLEGLFMYIAKYLAVCGVCSRRKAVEVVKSGEVLVNDKVVKDVTYFVLPKDEVKYNDQIVKPEKHKYILLNKPKDFITTVSDEKGRKSVLDLVKLKSQERIYPVGRLDRGTTGLLLLTNDGQLAQKLSHPRYIVSKQYNVILDRPFAQKDFTILLSGIKLRDGFIKPDVLRYSSSISKKRVAIKLHSGKNRIVRRMFEHFGYKIRKLDRSMYAGLTKKGLQPGKWRFLSKEEVDKLKKLWNMNNIGNSIIFMGVILVAFGIIIKFFPFSKLPGDIFIQKKNFTFYFPIITCIIISIVLSLLFFIFNFLFKK